MSLECNTITFLTHVIFLLYIKLPVRKYKNIIGKSIPFPIQFAMITTNNTLFTQHGGDYYDKGYDRRTT